MVGYVLDGLAPLCTHAEDFYPVVPALPSHSWWEECEESQWRVSLKCHGFAVCKWNALSVTETRISIPESLWEYLLNGSEVIWKPCLSVHHEVDMQALGHSSFQDKGLLSAGRTSDLLCTSPLYGYLGQSLLPWSSIDFSVILRWRKALRCCWGVRLWLKGEYCDAMEKAEAMRKPHTEKSVQTSGYKKEFVLLWAIVCLTPSWRPPLIAVVMQWKVDFWKKKYILVCIITPVVSCVL